MRCVNMVINLSSYAIDIKKGCVVNFLSDTAFDVLLNE